jgi:succinate dehydrogenase flavin-adding protein (antitoxin of CptAB toxin-antitoxin module)
VETDEDYGGDTHYSPNQTLEANEAIKEVLSRLFDANDPDYMFMFFSGVADGTGSDRTKLLDKAESAFRNNGNMASVKLKDKSRGLDMMLAYLDLIRSGNEKPLFKDITTVMSRQRVSPETEAARTESPPHNNDWTKAKEIAFSGLARAWKGDREVQATLSSFIAKNYNILSI